MVIGIGAAITASFREQVCPLLDNRDIVRRRALLLGIGYQTEVGIPGILRSRPIAKMSADDYRKAQPAHDQAESPSPGAEPWSGSRNRALLRLGRGDRPIPVQGAG